MAGLRKFRCYRRVKRAYTRKSKYKKKGYIKAAPESRIIRFDMGDTKKQFDYRIDLVAKVPHQIRSNAIESTRLLINRSLVKNLGTNFYFKIRVFPHHILRENKMLTGAGADRMQTGMQRAFGRAIGIAAQLKKQQPVMSIHVESNNLALARDALKKAYPRLPGKYALQTVKLQ